MKVRLICAALAFAALGQLTGCCCMRECLCRRFCCSAPANSCCKPALEVVGPIQPIPDPPAIQSAH